MLSSHFLDLYYSIKPVIPRSIQLLLRRRFVLRKRLMCGHIWPIDESAAAAPPGWSGWPDQKKFALVLTHDVDTAKGQSRCRSLMELESRLGFRSSFNFVPRRYDVSASLRMQMAGSGFEIGVHGLYHDGKYFRSEKLFSRRAVIINRYLREWQSVGFRSPSMLHNLRWMHVLDIEYDASTFDTDPFEPQPHGMKSIFPLWIQANAGPRGFVELPYTLPQDFTLFIMMREQNIDIWKRKLDWVAERGGMALLNTHPDYINFEGSGLGKEEYPADLYETLLSYIRTEYRNRYWHVLPKEIAKFWAGRLSGSAKCSVRPGSPIRPHSDSEQSPQDECLSGLHFTQMR